MPKPLPVHVSVRTAVPSDIPSIAATLASAPDDGTLWSFPNILNDEAGMLVPHAGWIASLMKDRTKLCRIAIVPGPNRDCEMVVGFSVWVKRVEVGGEIKAVDWVEEGELAIEASDVDRVLEEFKTGQEKDQQQRDGQGRSVDKESDALQPIKPRQDAIQQARKDSPSSPSALMPSYALVGLAVHAAYQGRGIGSLLISYGVQSGERDVVPVFVGGETRGVAVYMSLGFQKILDTEFWLDTQGRRVTREEAMLLMDGSDDTSQWRDVFGGLTMAQTVWVPRGSSLEIRGVVYSG